MNEPTNKVVLKGKIGTIKKTTKDGNAVYNFSMCTQNGDEYCWHSVFAFENEGVSLIGFSKGDSVIVEGRLRQSRYTATDGSVHIFTEVVATSVESTDQYAKIYTVVKEYKDSSGNYTTNVYSSGIVYDAHDYAVSSIAHMADKKGIDVDPYSVRELSGEDWWFRVRVDEQLIRIS